jgi:predicted secreted protein
MISMTEINARVGESYGVELPVAPTSGFQWALQSKPATSTLTGSSVNAKTQAGFGGTGSASFTFRALRTGSEVLKFTMSRAWDENIASEHYARVIISPP